MRLDKLTIGSAKNHERHQFKNLKNVTCELLAHGFDGEVKPLARLGSWEHQRARYTIDRLGFNEWNTPEDKRSRWQTLAILIVIAGNTANPVVEAEVRKYLSSDHEYSSFFRSAIGTHRDKAWLEELL